MSTDGKKRRRPRGSAWHWRQTDCWYFTPPGTKRRVSLVDEAGERIRGKENRQAAELALARLKVRDKWRPPVEPAPESQWTVAGVCSAYLQSCERRVAHGTFSRDHRDGVLRYLNDLCGYCGALAVEELRAGHIRHWIECHPTWQSPATQRNAIGIVMAAFNYARDRYDVPNPLKGLKKPPSRPRLLSFSAQDEEAIYGATDRLFGDFLLAAIHTGLRPFCELARLTANEILETDRGMMWRVYSSKTKKLRKIPVRSEVVERIRQLMEGTPSKSGAPLFCNSLGKPWKKATGGQRFRAIRRELGWDNDPVRSQFSCYTCRHTFAHRMLSGYWNGGVGCSIETLAELMGNTPKVAFEHYGREWGQHDQEPLWFAVLGNTPGLGWRETTSGKETKSLPVGQCECER